MTDLDEMKNVIVATVRDEELASCACAEIDGYAKAWPFVVMPHDWEIWNAGRTALKPDVSRWLEEQGDFYDLYLFRSGGGLFGFRNWHAASKFELAWSGKRRVPPAQATFAPEPGWNPHPVNSTFEPPCAA